MDSSPPGGTNPLWTFQIDGNLGAVGAACELLVQSHDAGIDLLPALPSAWPNGSVRGLRARGGHQLDLVWRDGTLARATLTSGRGLPCVLRDAAHLLVEQDGQPVKSYLSPVGRALLRHGDGRSLQPYADRKTPTWCPCRASRRPPGLGPARLNAIGGMRV